MCIIKFKKLTAAATIPKYLHGLEDSGFDFYSSEDSEVNNDQISLISTGLSCEIPHGYEIQIRPRSGLALKEGVTMSAVNSPGLKEGVTIVNSPGTIDAGYRGEIKILLFRLIGGKFSIKKGDRIAQGVVVKVEHPEIVEVETLENSSRGVGGFGSTGI